ncbi:DUF5685 family protein [Streptomyces sp. SBT349]|uniref:DUF5685 family protein n=1 Tax=Streptomyces sp. SBT349 TaxID=1580539 RepID=UPI00066AB5FC|nr:DUF5685 family protein [Streptomyces sp. SBT349]
MFGIIRPCRHRLPGGLRAEWMAHLCGLCLALRSTHGQAARLATNYDGLLISVLHDAQTEPGGTGGRRTAGPCPLRGMRRATVARGQGAELAAAVSLVLASAKIRDHADDGDGILARRSLATAARHVARGWDAAGARGGGRVGFDTAVLVEAVDRQQGVEALAGPGTLLPTVTEPTETATAAAFAHTAHLAGRPRNAAPLAEAGRLFGRIAHLLDAVEDQRTDRETGAWNPITATHTPLAEVRRLCEDAVLGVRLALGEAEFDDERLVHTLLVHELEHAVERTFDAAHHPHGDGSRRRPQPSSGRGLLPGCAVWTGLCCTGQLCCRDPYHDPWTGWKREGWCYKCGCCDCCRPKERRRRRKDQGKDDKGDCDCDCDCDCCDCCDCSC